MKNFYILVLLLVAGVSQAQYVNIPDTEFKNTLISYGYDTNDDGEIDVTEALAPTDLNISASTITDITGIEAFQNAQSIYVRGSSTMTSVTITNMPNLMSLNLDYNELTSVNLSNLPAIDTLSLNFNQLTALDVSLLPNLKAITFKNNNVASLNISTCTQLKKLHYPNNEISQEMLSLPPTNGIEDIDCLGNGLTTFDLSLFPSLKRIDCRANLFGVFTVPALSQLEYLECGSNQLTSLVLSPLLPALKEIRCQTGLIQTVDLSPYTTLEFADFSYNELTSFNIDGLINLKNLDVESTSNNIPSFNLTGLPALEYVSVWGNSHTTLDVSGLANLTVLKCGGDLMTTLNLADTPALKQLECQGSLLTQLDLAGHSNLEEIITNGNPLGTIDFSGAPNLRNITCQSNNLTALDVSMLPHLQNITCSFNAITALDFSNNPELIYVAAADADLLSVNLRNGSQQYFNDDWFNFPELQYICVDEGVETEWFQFNAQPGTVVGTYCSFTPGGDFNTITGTVIFDGNNNGCDAGDLPQQFVKMSIDDGMATGVSFNNGDGIYEFYTLSGNFTIAPDCENAAFFNFSPANAVVNFPVVDNSVSTINFCITANGVHPDLEVVIAPNIPARPGFDAVYLLTYRNKGNQVASGVVNFAYDENLMDFVSATVIPDAQSDGSLNWNYTNLMPFESRSVFVTVNINSPTETPAVNLGDALLFAASVTPLSGDDFPIDNQVTYTNIAVNSCDPNDKYCAEGEVISDDEIGNYLHYLIRFENVGSAPAINVVVKDIINEDMFDVSTLQIMSSSHPVDARLNENVAEFIFEDINLPIGGHGNILLKIKTRNDLVVGDEVINQANIFFDYNFPINTNEARTAFQTLEVTNPNYDGSISIYPNPTTDIINIKAATEIKSVQLFDVQGRLLQTAIVNDVKTSIDVSSKQSGIYFVKITSESGNRIEKILKQ